MNKQSKSRVRGSGDANNVPSPTASSSKIQLKTREILSKNKVLVRCSICLEDIYDPVRTPCDHYFCKECIYKFLDSKSHESDEKTGAKARIQCPNCKAKITKRALVPAPQLHDLLLGISVTNDAYKAFAGHSVLGDERVVFSARKRLPETDVEEPSPPKKNKSSKSKTVVEVVEEDKDATLKEPDKPKKRKKKGEGDVDSVKRNLLQNKKKKNVYSFSCSEEEEDEPINKKSVTASSKKAKTKKTSTKKTNGYDSDASATSKKSRSSKSENVSKKMSNKSIKKKVIEAEKITQEKEEEPLKPPPSPMAMPKPLRKVSKPREGTPNSLPSTSGAKSTSKSVPVASSSSSITKPLSVVTQGLKSTGRTRLPLISPLKRKEQQPVELDFDLSASHHTEPTLQERLRETISKVSASTPKLSLAPRPTLRNSMSPVTNGVAIVLSDDEGTIEATQSTNPTQTKEKSSNIDELLKEVEAKSIDREPDDGPILEEVPNRNYSRRSSTTSSEHSAVTKKSNAMFNKLLNRSPAPQKKILLSQQIQTDPQKPTTDNKEDDKDEDRLYKKLSKLFEALCTQHGVEGTINIQDIGRIEMKLTKGRASSSFANGSAGDDDHCLSQIVSHTKDKGTQSDALQSQNFACQVERERKNFSCQVIIKEEQVSKEVQTDDVVVKPAPEVIQLSQSDQGTQTLTTDHVSVGREVGNSKINTGTGSQNVNKKLNHHTSSSRANNSGNSEDDMGSDFSQSILDLLEEEDRQKEEELRKQKNANGEVISIAETPPRVLKRLSAGNNTTVSPSVLEQTTIDTTRRSLMSSFVDGESIIESDPEN